MGERSGRRRRSLPRRSPSPLTTALPLTSALPAVVSKALTASKPPATLKSLANFRPERVSESALVAPALRWLARSTLLVRCLGAGSSGAVVSAASEEVPKSLSPRSSPAMSSTLGSPNTRLKRCASAPETETYCQ